MYFLDLFLFSGGEKNKSKKKKKKYASFVHKLGFVRIVLDFVNTCTKTCNIICIKYHKHPMQHHHKIQTGP